MMSYYDTYPYEAIPEVKNGVLARSKDWLKEHRVEIGWTSVISVAAAGFLVACIEWGESDRAGIMDGITEDGKELIDGFNSIEVDGTMYDYTVGSLHNAIVTLRSGDTCSVQFAPVAVEHDGFIDWLTGRPDAEIVSYGTCPPVQD